MADNNLGINYSSPLTRCDSDGKEDVQKDPIVRISEEKYEYQRNTNKAAKKVSDSSSCRDQSVQPPRDPHAGNEARPVYGKKLRLLDQVKRKTKQPHAFSLLPGKHYKESKGNCKSGTKEKMAPAKDKRGVETKVHHSFYKTNSAEQGDCSVIESHDQSVKVTQTFFCNNDPESTKQRYVEVNASVPKCPQKLNRQIQRETQMRVRKPVHSVTVMPLSFISSVAEVECNDIEKNPLESIGSYPASATETVQPKVQTAESIGKANDAVPGKEREAHLSIIPVEHHKPEKQKQTPLHSEQQHQLKTLDYLSSFSNVPLQISQRTCISPRPFFYESQSETETSRRLHENNNLKDTKGIERRTFCPIINLSPPSPEPRDQEAITKHSKQGVSSSSKYDNIKPQQMTIQGLANYHIVDSHQRSPQKSPQPYLSPPDEESTKMHRRSPASSPTRNRSKSPLYIEDIKKRSKSPQTNWHPYMTPSTQSQLPIASNTNTIISSQRRRPLPYQPCGSPRSSGQSYGIDVLSKLSTLLLVRPPPEFLCRENAHSPSPYQNLQCWSSESSGNEEQLSSRSPVPCLAKRSNVPEEKNIKILKNINPIHRTETNPIHRTETQTEENCMPGTQEKVNCTLKRKLCLNKDQEQIEKYLTKSPKYTRKDYSPLIFGNDAKYSQVNNKKLDKESINSNSLTEKIDTCRANKEVKLRNLPYQTVAAKDISTQTIPTTVSKPVLVGNKRDRKTELGIDCKKSKEDNQESWFPNTTHCHLTHSSDQEFACSGNFISKTYFPSLDNGGNTEHLKQTTLNKQIDHQENLLNAIHTLPAPLIYEWPPRMGNALELPKKQVSANTSSQCTQHVLDSDIPVSNSQERRNYSSCPQSTMKSHYVTFNQVNLDKYNLEPGVYKAGDEHCFPKLPHICVANKAGNKEDHIHNGRRQKLPLPNNSNCNYHNVTSTGIIIHEGGKLDSSYKNKKENAGSKPLRFHLMTNFHARDTAATKSSSMCTTAKKDIEQEKRALNKTNQSKVKKTADLAPVTAKTNGKLSAKKANAVRSSTNFQESEIAHEKLNITHNVQNSSEPDFNNMSVPSTERCVTPLRGLLKNHLPDSVTPQKVRLTNGSSICGLKPVKSTLGENTTLSEENNKNNFDGAKQSTAKRRWKKLVRLCSLNKSLNQRPTPTDVTDCCKEITAVSVMTKNEKQICEKQNNVKDDANVTKNEPRSRGRTLANNDNGEVCLTTSNANRNIDTFKKSCEVSSSVQDTKHYENADTHKALNTVLPKLLSISAKNLLQSERVENQQENTTSVKITTEELTTQCHNSTSPKKADATDVSSRRVLNTSSKDLLNQSSDGSLSKKKMKKVNITIPLNTLGCKMSDSGNTTEKNKRKFAGKSQMVTKTLSASESAAQCDKLPFFEIEENNELANLPKQHSLSNKPLTPIMDFLQLSLNSKTFFPVDKVSVSSAVYESFNEKNMQLERKSNSNYKHALGQPMREMSSFKSINTQSKHINLKQLQRSDAFYAPMAQDNSQRSSMKNVKTTVTEISKIQKQNVDNDIALRANILSKLATNESSPQPMEKGESHLNLSNERTRNNSPKTKISNEQSTFQKKSIHSNYDVLSCSEMEASFSHDQSISNNKLIRSISPHFATVPSSSRMLNDKYLLPRCLNDRAAIETERQLKPVNSEQENKQSTPHYLSITGSNGSHFISYGTATSLRHDSNEGESPITRARSPREMFSTTHGRSLLQSHLIYNDQLNSMGNLVNSKSVTITPYSTTLDITMNHSSLSRALYVTCPDKFVTESPKETRSGSLTNVTWALLNDTQYHEARGDSSTESNNATKASDVADDDTKNSTGTYSDISTNLTWLLTDCPPEKFISREIQTSRPNQLDLYNKKSQWNQQKGEHHGAHHITSQEGRNKTNNSPFSSVKNLQKSSTSVEVSGKLAHKKTTHIAEHRRKQIIENPGKSFKCLQEIKVKMNDNTTNYEQKSLHSHTQAGHETRANGELETSVLSHLQIPSPHGAMEAASQTMQSTNNQSQLICLQKSEVLLPSSCPIYHYSSTWKKIKKEENEIIKQDRRIPNEAEQNISSKLIKSTCVTPANMHEVMDEFAQPEDCLPIIKATFSLKDRPDIQEQFKILGNQRQVEVDSSKVKCIEKSSLGKSNLE